MLANPRVAQALLDVNRDFAFFRKVQAVPKDPQTGEPQDPVELAKERLESSQPPLGYTYFYNACHVGYEGSEGDLTLLFDQDARFYYPPLLAWGVHARTYEMIHVLRIRESYPNFRERRSDDPGPWGRLDAGAVDLWLRAQTPQKWLWLESLRRETGEEPIEVARWVAQEEHNLEVERRVCEGLGIPWEVKDVPGEIRKRLGLPEEPPEEWPEDPKGSPVMAKYRKWEEETARKGSMYVPDGILKMQRERFRMWREEWNRKWPEIVEKMLVQVFGEEALPGEETPEAEEYEERETETASSVEWEETETVAARDEEEITPIEEEHPEPQAPEEKPEAPAVQVKREWKEKEVRDGGLVVCYGKDPEGSGHYPNWGWRGRISLDARPTGSGKTTSAREMLVSPIENPTGHGLMEERAKGVHGEWYPSFSVNMYVAPNNNVKAKVFGEIRGEKGLLKGKDSRIFLELYNSKAEKGIDKVYRKVGKEGGKPILSAVFGKNTMFYTLLLERHLRVLGVPHLSRVILDDFVPNMAITVLPVSKLDRMEGREVLRRDSLALAYYEEVGYRFLREREKGGISLFGLDDEQFFWLRELVSDAARFLLTYEEPIYLLEPRRPGHVWSRERLYDILVSGERLYVSSPEEFWATVSLLEWLVLGSGTAVLLTPNKPRASRALSAEREAHAEALFKAIAYMELLLAYRTAPWAREVLDRVREGEGVRLSDMQANTLIAHTLAAAGMDVHILDGTAILAGGGFIYHGEMGYSLTPQEDEKGRFLGWNAERYISDNPKSLERSAEGRRDDVVLDLSGETAFPAVEEGVRRFVERTGLDLGQVRVNLERSTVEPLMSIESIVLPEENPFVPLVYEDLEERLDRMEEGEGFGDFSGFQERVKQANSLSLVRNLHIIARSRRILADYDIPTKAVRLEDRVRKYLGQDEKFGLMSVYAVVLLAELLRRYAEPWGEDAVRMVLDPKILALVSHIPALWAQREELREDLALVGKYLPKAVAQANRGRSDKAVLGDRAVVLWLTAVDPLYERSQAFRYLVGLSEINQTLGRFVHRGPKTAERLVLVFLGGGKSGFTLKATAGLIHLLKEVESEEEKVPVYRADWVGYSKSMRLIWRLGTAPDELEEMALAEGQRAWLESAPEEALYGEEERKAVERILDDPEKDDWERVKEVLELDRESLAQTRVLSPEWYEDPDFDLKTPIRLRPVEVEEAPRTEKERKEMEENLRKVAERRKEKRIQSLKYTLSEEYGLSTSISDIGTLKRLIEHLEETGEVPQWARGKVWKEGGSFGEA